MNDVVFYGTMASLAGMTGWLCAIAVRMYMAHITSRLYWMSFFVTECLLVNAFVSLLRSPHG